MSTEIFKRTLILHIIRSREGTSDLRAKKPERIIGTNPIRHWGAFWPGPSDY